MEGKRVRNHLFGHHHSWCARLLCRIC